MADTLYLSKRNDTWHYCRRVPLDRVTVLGKTFIKQSLGVKGLSEAEELRNVLNVKFDIEFKAATLKLMSNEGELVSNDLGSEPIKVLVMANFH